MLPVHFPLHRLANLLWKGSSTSLASCARHASSGRDPWTAEISAANQELEEAFNTPLGVPGHHDSWAGPAGTSKDHPLSSLSRSRVPTFTPSKPSLPRRPTSILQGVAAEAAQHSRQQATEHQSADRLTHVDNMGHASMVDVSQKKPSVRSAQASGCVYLGPKAYELVAANRAAKGDVLAVSQIAGIMAAKQTSMLIPLCHGIPLNKVDVTFHLDPSSHSVHIKSEASCTGVTGVEMEALTAACVASLTVYDMCKAVSKGIVISDIRLEAKTGGKSGDWRRTE
uniref:cyclic pyranopterin monophosphate synthase n=1 Tax=Dunaliella tertiolecta TaxID=3047 RepID=A0A6S8I9H9_DUNTE|mmetsp:Transcript_20002/g.55696  ORF Transcript_20002/g.55696 Transcript_20002/m.55696 type:complete len:283 (-) Transcript_20002:863-1711(-)